MGRAWDWNEILQGIDRSLFFEVRMEFLTSEFFRSLLEKSVSENRDNEAERFFEVSHLSKIYNLSENYEEAYNAGENFGYGYLKYYEDRVRSNIQSYSDINEIYLDEEYVPFEKESANDKLREENEWRVLSSEYEVSPDDVIVTKSISERKYDSAGELLLDEDKFLPGEINVECYEDSNTYDEQLVESITETLMNEKLYTMYDSEKFKEQGMLFDKDEVIVKKNMTEKILDYRLEKRGSEGGNIKIEMNNTNNITKEIDIEETLDLISERLCEIMSRSADGLYL